MIFRENRTRLQGIITMSGACSRFYSENRFARSKIGVLREGFLATYRREGVTDESTSGSVPERYAGAASRRQKHRSRRIHVHGEEQTRSLRLSDGPHRSER